MTVSPNQISTQQLITNRTLDALESKTVIWRTMTRADVPMTGLSNDLSTMVRRPPRYMVEEGEEFNPQTSIIGKEWFHIDKNLLTGITRSGMEQLQKVDASVHDMEVSAMASALATKVDLYQSASYLMLANRIGVYTDGNIKTATDLGEAMAKLTALGCPTTSSDMIYVLQTGDHMAVNYQLLAGNTDFNSAAFSGYAIPSQTIFGSKVISSTNLPNLTTGSRQNGKLVVSGANPGAVDYIDVDKNPYAGQKLSISGIGANATIKAGETFTVAGVKAVNLANNQTVTKYLRDFVVISDATADGAGLVQVEIAPAIVVADSVIKAGGDKRINSAYATVDRAPVHDAAVTFGGMANKTYTFSVLLHKNACHYAFAKPPTVDGGTATYQSTDGGMSMRMWNQSNITTNHNAGRADVVTGVRCLDPNLGILIMGAAKA